MTVVRPTIPAELRDAILRVVAAVPEIAAVYVFGSVARGQARADSDLDVGVVYRDRGTQVHDRLVAALAGRLGAATGFEAVDVVDLEAQGPIFAHEVLCEAALVTTPIRIAGSTSSPTRSCARSTSAPPTSSQRAERRQPCADGSRAAMTSEQVQGKLDILRSNLERLDAIPQATFDEFEADFRNVAATLYLLQTSVQALIDVAAWLVTTHALAIPRTSHDVFERLEAAGLLTAGTSVRVAPIVGFRNRVVHLYDRIDDRRVYEILTHRNGLPQLLHQLLGALAPE